MNFEKEVKFLQLQVSDILRKIKAKSTSWGQLLGDIRNQKDLMRYVNFRNNFLNSGSIDATKADLTQTNAVSSINTIGNNIVESLVKYDDRAAAALLAGRPLYSAYLKTSGVAYPTTIGWVRDIVLPA